MKNTCLNFIIESKHADECESDLRKENVDSMIKSLMVKDINSKTICVVFQVKG